MFTQIEAIGLILNLCGALFMFLGSYQERSPRLALWGMMILLVGFGLQLLAIVLEPYYG